MVVGQAPGRQEAQMGTPFSDPAGHRLFQWLATAGWAEEEFRASEYITAITKCYPGLSPGGRGDRVPSPAERSLCLPFLARGLDLIEPRVVVPVGRVALHQLLGSGPLDGLVGNRFDAVGRIIVPLPHPSGANLWLNRCESRDRLSLAIGILADLRTAENL
jgi:uracil-DNA glycosylase